MITMILVNDHQSHLEFLQSEIYRDFHAFHDIVIYIDIWMRFV